MRIFSVFLAGTMLAGPALAQTAGGGQAAPTGAPTATSISPPVQMRPFQPVGSFPTNTMTARPFVGPQQGNEGYKVTVAALQRTLTELQQLQLQIKEAHWNVSGTLFWSLHTMLQEHYEGVSKYADMVAERLLAIGSSADGRATTIVRTSRLPEIPGGFLDDAQEIAWFTSAYKIVGDEIRQAIIDTEKADPTTSNLLQEVELNIDKYQWQVRAFVQNTPTDPNTGWDLNNRQPIDVPAGPPGSQPGAGAQPATGSQPGTPAAPK